MTVMVLLVVVTFLLTIASGIGKCPLWIPVLLLSIMELVKLLQ